VPGASQSLWIREGFSRFVGQWISRMGKVTVYEFDLVPMPQKVP
jgi:hypothetical protein